jgi:hypothetical protein
MKVPKTFYSIQTVARMMDIPKATIDSVFDSGIDSVQAIKPIAHLFHKFEEGDEVSFAILKKHFDKWQHTGKVPKVSSGRPPKWKDNPEYDRLDVAIKASLKKKFVEGIKNINRVSVQQVNMYDCVAAAIKEYMDRRPSVFGVDENAETANKSSGNRR